MCQPALRIILLDEVQDNGAALPQREPRVRVLDGGHAAVGVEGDEGRLLDVVEFEGDDFVGQAEFFEDDEDFVGVGARCLGGSVSGWCLGGLDKEGGGWGDWAHG